MSFVSRLALSYAAAICFAAPAPGGLLLETKRGKARVEILVGGCYSCPGRLGRKGWRGRGGGGSSAGFEWLVCGGAVLRARLLGAARPRALGPKGLA